jgi:AcrR family transcriptional regulator
MSAAGQVRVETANQARRPERSVRDDISHNLNGQKLGRKGRITRERILAATIELLEEGGESSISLSAVARRASLAMTTLYIYFSDLTELLLAVLEPIRDEADSTFLDIVRDYWPDDRLEELCRLYVESYYAFWTKHSRILHLRNNMSDQYDERMVDARVRSAQPAIALFRRQLMPPGIAPSLEADNMASVLTTAIERAVTVATDPVMPAMIERKFGPRHTSVVEPLTRIILLAIRDQRSRESSAA